jgi:hypothetical protein
VVFDFLRDHQIFLMRQFQSIFAHKTKQIYSIQCPSRLLPEMIRSMIIFKIPQRSNFWKAFSPRGVGGPPSPLLDDGGGLLPP